MIADLKLTYEIDSTFTFKWNLFLGSLNVDLQLIFYCLWR